MRLDPERTLTEVSRNCDCFRLNGEHTWSFLPFHNVAVGWDPFKRYTLVYSPYRL